VPIEQKTVWPAQTPDRLTKMRNLLTVSRSEPLASSWYELQCTSIEEERAEINSRRNGMAAISRWLPSIERVWVRRELRSGVKIYRSTDIKFPYLSTALHFIARIRFGQNIFLGNFEKRLLHVSWNELLTGTNKFICHQSEYFALNWREKLIHS
jgi:hypothetical protein